jgi:hypothetical protein
MIKNKTSIIIENSTRNELRKIGRKEQTYDQLIRELIGIKQNLELGRKNSEFPNYSSKKSLSHELEYL